MANAQAKKCGSRSVRNACACSMEPSFYRPGVAPKIAAVSSVLICSMSRRSRHCAVVVGQHVDAAADKRSSFVAQQLFIGRPLPPTYALRMMARFVKRRQQRVDRNLGLVGVEIAASSGRR